MNLSLIICTYMRPQAVCTLLDSVCEQTLQPNEILIVDGSTDNYTELTIKEKRYNLPIHYHAVPPEHRGLTRQRNYGIAHVEKGCDLVAFLDDDVVLLPDYFKRIVEPFTDTEMVGVGGYILDHENPNAWRQLNEGEKPNPDEYVYDGWARKDASRMILRRRLGLAPDTPPCIMPEFSNGRSVGNLPPNGKVYHAEYFMGGVSVFRRSLFEKQRFSPYFEGYGLYEDLDFTLRASFIGKECVHTGACLYHYHDPGGRPNQFKYGKMVIRNGWYVWRLKYPKPRIKARMKWYAIELLQTTIRYGNVFSTSDQWGALSEAWGRTVGLFSVMFNPPKRID